MKKTIRIAWILIFLIYSVNILADSPKTEKDFIYLLSPVRGHEGERSVPIYLQFDIDSAVLSPEDKDQLRELGKALRNEGLRNFRYRIEGHTCDIGDPDYNLKLSTRRAKSVRNFLVSNFHLPSKQFEIKGFGLTKPLVPNKDEASRAKNRRAVIVNTMKKVSKTDKPKKKKTVISKSDRPSENAPISVQAIKLVKNTSADLQEGDILTHKDNYAIKFKPHSQLYVYAYVADARGKIYQSFPNADHTPEKNPARPGKSYRIPQNPLNWLYLNKDTGKEHIIVLATKKALQNPEKVCTDQLNLSPYEDQGIELASSSTSGIPKERGWKGVGQKYPVTTPQKQETPGDLFVWKRYFIHK